MMSFCYNGKPERPAKELTLDATTENLDHVLEFVNEELDALSCTMKTKMRIDVAVEELFVNIAHYAYEAGTGQATIRIRYEADSDTLEICFIDGGKPFDPLARPDPDLTLSVEERQIGGLGIYMAKKNMDDIRYAYEDEKNILTIRKRLNSSAS